MADADIVAVPTVLTRLNSHQLCDYLQLQLIFDITFKTSSTKFHFLLVHNILILQCKLEIFSQNNRRILR